MPCFTPAYADPLKEPNHQSQCQPSHAKQERNGAQHQSQRTEHSSLLNQTQNGKFS